MENYSDLDEILNRALDENANERSAVDSIVAELNSIPHHTDDLAEHLSSELDQTSSRFQTYMNSFCAELDETVLPEEVASPTCEQNEVSTRLVEECVLDQHVAGSAVLTPQTQQPTGIFTPCMGNVLQQQESVLQQPVTYLSQVGTSNYNSSDWQPQAPWEPQAPFMVPSFHSAPALQSVLPYQGSYDCFYGAAAPLDYAPIQSNYMLPLEGSTYPLQELSPSTSTQQPTQGPKPRKVNIRYGKELFCVDCGKEFGTKSSYQQHRTQKHQGPRTFRCGTCGKLYASESELHRHQQNHTLSMKQYQCSECDKRYRHKRDLDRHYVTHHGTPEYPCPVEGCNKAFARRDHMMAHQVTHENRAIRKLRKELKKDTERRKY